MTINEFKDYVKTGNALDTEDIHMFMDEMSDAARRITFRLNAAYHTQAEVRKLLSELFGCDVPSSLRVFPPFYTDFGKNITIGENVFINACCHFQDHGGVVIGDGCQIGHNVVFATLNHGLSPEERKHTYPAPIVLGKNVWVGSNSTILQGVTVGEKENPCKITILETYASKEAYDKHIASEHFRKYKQGTLHMVKSLELTDQTPLNPANRINNFME